MCALRVCVALRIHVLCMPVRLCVYDVCGIYVGVCIHGYLYTYVIFWCVCVYDIFVCGVCVLCALSISYAYVCGGMPTV